MQRLTDMNKPINVKFGERTQHSNAWQHGKYYERIPLYVEESMSILLKTDKCLSLGAKQNTNKETGEAYGWVLQICLQEEQDATFLHALQDVIEQAKAKVRYDFLGAISDEKVGGCLWDCGENGKVLYAKIVESKGWAAKCNTHFSKVDDISFPTMKRKVTKEEITECCSVQAVICIDSIIVCENKAHLKIQVYEANVQNLERQSFL